MTRDRNRVSLPDLPRFCRGRSGHPLSRPWAGSRCAAAAGHPSRPRRRHHCRHQSWSWALQRRTTDHAEPAVFVPHVQAVSKRAVDAFQACFATEPLVDAATSATSTLPPDGEGTARAGGSGPDSLFRRSRPRTSLPTAFQPLRSHIDSQPGQGCVGHAPLVSRSMPGSAIRLKDLCSKPGWRR